MDQSAVRNYPDIHDPGTEVWICECGVLVEERGPCIDCLLTEAEPLRIPGFFWISLIVIMALMITGIWLMVRVAWLEYKTFGG